MVIQCPNCKRKYKIDPERVSEKGTRVTCQNCGHNFSIRKKKEAGPAPTKTPPCQICGAPSTRVLKADPPMILCEACFEREKEKTRRMFAPPQVGIQSEPEPKLEGAKFPGIPPSPSVPEKAPYEASPKVKEEKFAKPEAEPPETQYFDSFAEIPDLGEYQVTPQDTSEPISDKAEATLMDELQKFKKTEAPKIEKPKMEMPVFDETGFEAPAEPKPMTRQEKAPTPPSQPFETETIAPDEFVFSPKEVERMETLSQEKPAYLREKIETGPPKLTEKKEAELEREIFGELAEPKKPEEEEKIAPISVKTSRIKLPPISARNAIIIGVLILVLTGGVFALWHFLSRRPPSEMTGKGPAKKILSEEEQKILFEHLNFAEQLYRLDTEDDYLQALNEIRASLKIDKNSRPANALNMLVTSFLAYRTPSFLSISRAKALNKKADAELSQQPDFQAGRALLYLAEQNYPAARIIAEKLMKEHSDYALGYWILAQINLTGPVKNVNQAESLLQQAIQLDPKLIQARVSLAELQFQQKQYQFALEQYQEILKISPQHREANARIQEIQNLIAQAKPLEEKPTAGLLLAQPTTSTPMTQTTTPETTLLPIKIEPEASTTASAPVPTQEKTKLDLNQELQNYLLKIIAETRAPMSRERASTPPQIPTVPTTPTPAHPPEEAPAPSFPTRPPEEAP